jgi:UDP-glucuronate 4-epimerase
MAHAYSHLYGLHTTGLRYFTVYGPWGRPDMAMFIFTDKILKDKTIPVYNHGNMKRDFTYIDDIIAGTRSAMEKNYLCEVFNLGNHKSENLMDMIGIIEDNLGSKAKIEFHPMQPGDVPESFADINKSIEMLSYRPTTDINEGIPRFITWYKDYYKM